MWTSAVQSILLRAPKNIIFKHSVNKCNLPTNYFPPQIWNYALQLRQQLLTGQFRSVNCFKLSPFVGITICYLPGQATMGTWLKVYICVQCLGWFWTVFVPCTVKQRQLYRHNMSWNKPVVLHCRGVFIHCGSAQPLICYYFPHSRQTDYQRNGRKQKIYYYNFENPV
jgi:hypothetical protein